MFSNQLLTSDQWFAYNNGKDKYHIIIMEDTAGWNQKDLQFAWYEEKITMKNSRNGCNCHQDVQSRNQKQRKRGWTIMNSTHKKIILHLCADTGSDTMPYQNSDEFEVIKVGAAIGVENFHAPENVYGIIANPVCLEFSTARAGGKARNPQDGMFLVNECLRIIDEAKAHGTLKFWVIENPAKGVLKDFLGQPRHSYEPWWYGSPWTKRTSQWGEFNIPERKYMKWEDVPKIPELYIRPNRPKPSLAFMHKSAVKLIPEFVEAGFTPDSDMEFRSLCSQKYAQAFFEVNQ